LPARTFKHTARNNISITERVVKTYLLQKEFYEFYTYGLVSKTLWEKCLLDPQKLLKLKNPSSPEYEFIRNDLIPSLLNKIELNIGTVEYKCYELSRVVFKNKDGEMHVQPFTLGFCNTRKPNSNNNAFLELTSDIYSLLDKLNIKYEVECLIDNQDAFINHALFHPYRTAVIYSKGDKSIVLGVVGEVHPQILTNMGLQNDLAVGELDFDKLVTLFNPNITTYKPISIFQSIERDLSIALNKDVLISSIVDFIESQNIKEIESVKIIDRYLNDNKEAVTIRLKLDSDHTLKTSEIDSIISNLTKKITESFSITIR